MAIQMDSTDNTGNCNCPDSSLLWTTEDVQQLHEDLIFWVDACKTLNAHKLDAGDVRNAYIAAINDAVRKIETRKRAVRHGK
jgi:hypothetical protein